MDRVVIQRKEARERGLTRFFTGVPCKHGHITERSVKWKTCVGCESAKTKIQNAKTKAENHERKRLTAEWWKPILFRTVIQRQEAVEQGLKKYFLGIPCKNQHLSERWAATYTCVECQKETTRNVKAQERELRLTNAGKPRSDLECLPTKKREALAQGLTRYFTRVPCRRGHLAERNVNNGSCVACNAITKVSEARLAGKKAAGRAYYAKNKEHVLTKNREWRREHPEQYRLAQYRWGVANPPKNRPAGAAWRLKHKQRLFEKAKQWRLDHKEIARERTRNRRAKRKSVPGRHTAKQIAELMEKQNGKCAYCYVSIVARYHADHIVPVSRGGSNDIKNIQLTCPTCNVRKSAKPSIQFTLERLLSLDSV